MAKRYTKKLEPISDHGQLEEAIKSAGAWFIGTFMMELVDSFDCFSTKDKKNQFMDYFYNEYAGSLGTRKEVTGQINTAIRIIESGLVKEAMECVVSTDGCEDAAKDAAKILMENLASEAVVLPEFHK